jgi:hypothetical protein
MNAEAICANLVQLLREGYEVRFRPFEHTGLELFSVTVTHPQRDIYVRQAGVFSDFGDVMDSAYGQVPEEANDAD